MYSKAKCTMDVKGQLKLFRECPAPDMILYRSFLMLKQAKTVTHPKLSVLASSGAPAEDTSW